MRQPLLLLLVLWCGAASVAQAQVYKTVDEHGNVRYSDGPPARSKSQRLEIRSSSAEEIARATEKRQKFLEDQRHKKEEEVAQQAKRKVECDRLLSIRTQLGLPGPYSVPTEDGGVLFVTGHAKLELKRSIEQEIREKCQAL